MATKARYVDVLSPRVNVQEGNEPVLFEDILFFMENKEYRLGEKSFKFTLYNDNFGKENIFDYSISDDFENDSGFRHTS